MSSFELLEKNERQKKIKSKNKSREARKEILEWINERKTQVKHVEGRKSKCHTHKKDPVTKQRKSTQNFRILDFAGKCLSSVCS